MEKEKTPLAKKPEAWRMSAIGHKRSADIIWEKWFGIVGQLDGGKMVPIKSSQEIGDVLTLLPPFLLLAGLALENVLKGLLVFNKPSFVDSQVNWNIRLGGHDLEALANSIELDPTSEEKEFLNDLTQAVLWSGRYPVPKHHDNQIEIGIPFGSFIHNSDITTIVSRMSDSKNMFDRLFLQILNRYPGTINSQPNKENLSDS